MYVTQERGEGRLTKKVTKITQEEGSQPKNVMSLIRKKTTKSRDYASDVLSNADLFCYIFYECIC